MTVRLAAAVAWRGVPTSGALRGGRGPLGWLRRARHRFWQRLGPMGLDVSVAGRPLFGGTDGARGIEMVCAEPDGEPMAYYDNCAHVLRVLGRVVQARPDGTVVALIDATGGRAASPRLIFRVVATPPIPVPRIDSVPLEDHTGVRNIAIRGEVPTWEAALRADPVVRAFLDDRVD